MKRTSFLKEFALPVLLFVFFAAFCRGAAAQEQEGKELTFQQIAAEVEKRLPDAEQKILAGIALVEELLKSSKTEASQMTGKWNEIREQSFSAPVMKEMAQLNPMLRLSLEKSMHAMGAAAKAKMQKRPSSSAPPPPSSGQSGITIFNARDIHKDAEELLGFAQEIQSVGEAVAWTLKVNRHIESLEFDIGTAPVRVEAYVTQMRKTSDILTGFLRKIKEVSGGQRNYTDMKAELSKYADSVNMLRIVTVNSAYSLVNTARFLEPQGRYVIPETELKRMEVLADYWKDIKNLYPLLKQEIADGVARWAPSPKAKWANYLESKKEFNKVYAPLLAGDIFKGIPHFEGKKYDQLADILLVTQRDLYALISMTENREQKAEAARKLLEQDEALTRKEQEEIRNLEAMYGPEREKMLTNAVHKAGGGYARYVELERFIENSEIKDGAYDRAKEELDSLRKRRHPEQRAADAALTTFYKGLAEAQKRVDSIVKDHTKRKKDLGFEPVLKESRLAKEKVYDTLKPMSERN